MNSKQANILTILICSYNSEQFLKECLDSLTKQIVPSTSYKVLFVNDGSTDGSFEIADSYSKHLENFTVLNNKERKGLISCCNKALDSIDTPYFMRLDADDYLSSDAVDKILTEVNLLPKKGFIIFKRQDIGKSGIEEAEVNNDIYTWIAVNTVFGTKSVKSVKGYSNEYWEEYDLYIKLLESGCVYKVSPHCIYYYRRGHQSMTQDYIKNKKGFESLIGKWGLETLKKYGDLEKILEYYKVKREGLSV